MRSAPGAVRFLSLASVIAVTARVCWGGPVSGWAKESAASSNESSKGERQSTLEQQGARTSSPLAGSRVG